jgi:hypothetical protein
MTGVSDALRYTPHHRIPALDFARADKASVPRVSASLRPRVYLTTVSRLPSTRPHAES